MEGAEGGSGALTGGGVGLGGDAANVEAGGELGAISPVVGIL